jgi:hypothetical protein
MKTRVTLTTAVLALAPCALQQNIETILFSVTAQCTKVITNTATSIKPVTKR